MLIVVCSSEDIHGLRSKTTVSKDPPPGEFVATSGGVPDCEKEVLRDVP